MDTCFQKVRKSWNRDISTETNLADYFQNSFGVKVPVISLQTDPSILKLYNGEQILNEEAQREETNIQLVKSQVEKFVTNPHFDLTIENISASFDPRNIIPLDEFGTVYPTIRVTDNWGILTVKNGALMSPNWSKITITEPVEISANVVKGDGWTLELNTDAYTIRKDMYTTHYYLTKK